MKPYYSHNGIEIYHGDCRDFFAERYGQSHSQKECLVSQTISSEGEGATPSIRPIAVVSDPPYGISLNTLTRTSGRQGSHYKGFAAKRLAHDLKPIVGDDEPFDPAHLLDFASVILWGAIHYADKLPVSARWLVWDKRCGSASDDNADCEFAWTNLKGQARVLQHYWRGWLREGRENLSISGAKLHPAQKPVSLMKWCIGFVPSDAVILDPYCGSCSTLVAAKEEGRQAIGIEISEEYCEIGAKRLSQETLQFEPQVSVEPTQETLLLKSERNL